MAYHTREHAELAAAFEQLEGQRGKIEELRSDQSVPGAMIAAWERDAGDVHVGTLHWSKASDELPYLDGSRPMQIDGAGIRHLTFASEEFARLYRWSGDPMMLAEWAASQSSLAMAQAQTARLLRSDLNFNPGQLAPTSEVLRRGFPHSGASTPTLSLEDKSVELALDAERTSYRVWRVYLGLLNQPVQVSFRWARTISNIAHALSYVVMLDGPEKRCAAAALSEVAFRSILDIAVTTGRPRVVGTAFDKMWYGGLLDTGSLGGGGVHYNDDHQDRYVVNERGFIDLLNVIDPA
ncbi:hypothetical protein [Engelhardtia mirabilis]|uniref:hypothetical protein n=1 Tax=Engelhardtia mirabilis TaxID=2528011 RepID=UPI0011A11E60